jgi:CheY-like chemotaxis protein/transcriptional regulator with XRE-family HTH domain
MNSAIDNQGRDLLGTSLGSVYAGALFDRHGIPQNKRAEALEEKLGLSYSPAHRRLTGSAPFTLEELKRLAEAYGESLSKMIAAVEGDKDGDAGELAVFVTGEAQRKCRVWLGKALAADLTTKDLVARRTESGVTVSLGGPPGPNAFSVTKMVMEASNRVAVLDDDIVIANGVSRYLRRQGFRSDPYTTIPRVLEAIEGIAYDAYIFDWIVHDEPVLDLVKQIRASDNSCYIAILTGQIASDHIGARELLDACEMFNMRAFEKPTTHSLISESIARALAL